MKLDRISQKAFFSSVGLALVSALCLSMAAGFWQYLTTLGPLQVVVVARFFFPFLLLAVWALVRRMRLHVHSIGPHLWRAVMVVGAQYCFLFVLARANLLLATLLYATSGLFSPIVLYLFLRVRASKKAIAATVIGFVGVAVALGTWSALLTPLVWVGLLSGLLTAVAQVIQHRTSKSDSIAVINFILFGVCSLFSVVLALVSPPVWRIELYSVSPIATLIGVVVAFSVLTIANQSLKNAAFNRVNKPTTLVPFFYGSIVFSGVIDWLWHGIVPQLHTIIGVCIIIVGGAIMSVRKV